MSNETYQRFAKFYDAYVTNFTKDLPLYSTYCTSMDQILEIGCGTGRVLKFLADQGCTVIGVDISAAMLEIAMNKLRSEIQKGTVTLKNFNFVNGYLRDSFNRVLITFYTINYLIEEEKLVCFLANIHKSMSVDGFLLMDLFYPRPMAKPETEGIIFEDKIIIEEIEIPYQDCRRMVGDMEIREQKYRFAGDIIEINTYRKFYSKQQMIHLLRSAGFRHIEVTEGYDPQGFHETFANEQTNKSFVIKSIRY